MREGISGVYLVFIKRERFPCQHKVQGKPKVNEVVIAIDGAVNNRPVGKPQEKV
jgi:hypothetical protein